MRRNPALARYEVDQPVLAAKRHGGLGSIEGQRQQALAFATCEDDGQRLGHCRYRSSRLSPEYAVGQGAHPRPTVSLAKGHEMLQPGDRLLRLERGGAPRSGRPGGGRVAAPAPESRPGPVWRVLS